MKAIVYDKYGPPEVLKIKEIEKPVPKDNEVLIKVHATTSTAAEIMMRSGKPYWGRLILGLLQPSKKYRILGIEFAGEIEATGKQVNKFKVSDKIFGFTGFHPGAAAEYLCLPEKASMAIKPANLNWVESAASVDGATTALFFLKEKAKIQPGQRVLIIGASGSIGTFAVQLASYYGAEVTGVCSSKNIELVKSLGAQRVIDYTEEDFIKSGNSYHIIFDTVGKSSFPKCKSVLTANGCYVPTVGLINYVYMLRTSLIRSLPGIKTGKRVIAGMSVEKNEALNELSKLLEAGKIKPVIDRIYTLEQLAEAHSYVEQGHKKGNVCISVISDNEFS